MNCTEARLQIGAEPGASYSELTEHLRTCATCRTFQQEMIALDTDIRRALEIGVLPQTDAHERSARRVRVGPRQVAAPRHWALAAGLLIAVATGTLLWGLRPSDSLAAEIVAHVGMEPESWASRAAVPQPALDLVLRRSGIEVDAAAGNVVYARSCPFRGRDVPHLVVTTAHGPVTVLVLSGERIDSRRKFSEHGYTGVLLPASGGTLAVLARGAAPVDEAARAVMLAIRWAQ